MTVLIYGLLILIGAGAWLLFRWCATAPVTPDPWGAEVTAEMARPDCPQVCHRCLAEHEASAHFCPSCGALVGDCTSIIPPLCYYAIGDVFRAGAEGRYRGSWPLRVGYFFVAAYGFLHWVPFPLGVPCLLVFWNKLFKNSPPGIGTVVGDGDADG